MLTVRTELALQAQDAYLGLASDVRVQILGYCTPYQQYWLCHKDLFHVLLHIWLK